METVVTRLRARQMVRGMLDFVFPPTCIQCKQVGAILCAECCQKFPRVPQPVCEKCGRPLRASNNQCKLCRERPLQLQHIHAPLLFVEPITSIIHKFKYNGYFALAKPLAQIMLESWPVNQQSYGIIIPIPLHPRRLKKRGFNQSAQLAQYLGQNLQLPVNTTALKRTRHTTPQVGLSAVERLANVKDAFEAQASQVTGQHIYLIDDVYTTGSTMSAAAQALFAVGAVTVSGYCVAQTA